MRRTYNVELIAAWLLFIGASCFLVGSALNLWMAYDRNYMFRHYISQAMDGLKKKHDL